MYHGLMVFIIVQSFVLQCVTGQLTVGYTHRDACRGIFHCVTCKDMYDSTIFIKDH